MKTPLILIHGAGAAAANWELDRGHWHGLRPIAVDLPGRGDRPGPARSTAEESAAWLAERLPTEPTVLVGHSYGGAVALQLALDRPERVAGLVLVSSGARLAVHPAILFALEAATTESPFRMDAGFAPGTTTAVRDRYHALSREVPPVTALADWRACNAFDVRDRLGEIEVPTLVVYGSEDFLTPPKFQRRLVERVHDASEVVIPGRGHMLPYEDPGGLVAAVRDWMDGRGLASG